MRLKKSMCLTALASKPGSKYSPILSEIQSSPSTAWRLLIENHIWPQWLIRLIKFAALEWPDTFQIRNNLKYSCYAFGEKPFYLLQMMQLSYRYTQILMTNTLFISKLKKRKLIATITFGICLGCETRGCYLAEASRFDLDRAAQMQERVCRLWVTALK